MAFVSVNYYGLGNGLMNKLQEEQSSDHVIQLGCGEFLHKSKETQSMLNT